MTGREPGLFPGCPSTRFLGRFVLETSLSQPAEAWFIITRRNLALIGLCGLLLSEVLILTLRFDSQALVDRGLPLVGYARYLPQAMIVVVAAALVLRGRGRLLGTVAVDPVAGLRQGWPLFFLSAHLAAFAALVVLTGAVWEGSLGRSPHATAWLAAWFATALATLALWLATVLPASGWARLLRRSSGLIVAAVAVGAAACYAGRLTSVLLVPLHAATLGCVHGLLAILFSDTVYRPLKNVVGTEAFAVEVASECSGYEGIGLIWVFLAAYLWFFRRTLRFPQALWLLPIGTVVIWLANIVRIVTLVAIGSRISSKVAVGGFHSQAGWLAFNAVALGLVAVSRRARIFAIDDAPRAVDAPSATLPNPTAAYLGPLLALVGTVMVTTALSQGGPGLDVYYPARIVTVIAVLWIFRRAYEGLRWTWSWPALLIGGLVFAIWMTLEPASTGGSRALADDLARLPRVLAALWLAARVFGSVVTVPIAEELAFRGYLTRRLIAADFLSVSPGRFTWFSFLVSSLLFGVLHGRTLAGVLAGACYALAFYRRGNLSDAILAHATTNALIAAYVLSTGSWSLWS